MYIYNHKDKKNLSWNCPFKLTFVQLWHDLREGGALQQPRGEEVLQGALPGQHLVVLTLWQKPR